MLLSLIIPVYNREDEMKDLLHSLSLQENKGFEVIVVEDGSKNRVDHLVEQYSDRLDIKYYYKQNSGPGLTRNYGSDRASGNYLIYLDSDCIIPPQYTEVLHTFLSENEIDAFGGPDAASEDFSDFQKAVSYSMTSFFTTGGIRGGKLKLDRFYPRSFNMGYRREVYDKLGGFTGMRYGEDMELSYRLKENGCSSALITDAYVYHKRRSTAKSFFKQVFFFGVARINLYKRYPLTLKLAHILPSLFLIYTLFSILFSMFINRYAILPIFIIMLIWLIQSTYLNKSLNVGIISVRTSFIQLFGYGSGFIYGAVMRIILNKTEGETYDY